MWIFVLIVLSQIAIAQCPDPNDPSCEEFNQVDPSTWDETNIDQVPVDQLSSHPDVAIKYWSNIDTGKKEELFARDFDRFKGAGRADAYFTEKIGNRKPISGLDAVSGVSYSSGVLINGDARLDQNHFPAEAISAKAIEGGFIFIYGNQNEIEVLHGSISQDNKLEDGSVVKFSGAGQSARVEDNKVTLSGASITVRSNNIHVIGESAHAEIIQDGETAEVISGKFEYKDGAVVLESFDGKQSTFENKLTNLKVSTVGYPLVVVPQGNKIPSGFDPDIHNMVIYAEDFLQTNGAVEVSYKDFHITSKPEKDSDSVNSIFRFQNGETFAYGSIVVETSQYKYQGLKDSSTYTKQQNGISNFYCGDEEGDVAIFTNKIMLGDLAAEQGFVVDEITLADGKKITDLGITAVISKKDEKYSLNLDKGSLLLAAEIEKDPYKFALVNDFTLTLGDSQQASFVMSPDLGMVYDAGDGNPVRSLSPRKTHYYLGSDLPTVANIAQRGIERHEQDTAINRILLQKAYSLLQNEKDEVESFEQMKSFIDNMGSGSKYTYKAAFVLDNIGHLDSRSLDKEFYARNLLEVETSINNFAFFSAQFSPADVKDYLSLKHDIGTRNQLFNSVQESKDELQLRLATYIRLNEIKGSADFGISDSKVADAWRSLYYLENIDGNGNYMDTGPSESKINLLSNLAVASANTGRISDSINIQNNIRKMAADLRLKYTTELESIGSATDKSAEAADLKRKLGALDGFENSDYPRFITGRNLKNIRDSILFREELLSDVENERTPLFDRDTGIDYSSNPYLYQGIGLLQSVSGGYFLAAANALGMSDEALGYVSKMRDIDKQYMSGYNLVDTMINDLGYNGEEAYRIISSGSEEELKTLSDQLSIHIITDDKRLQGSIGTAEFDEYMGARRDYLTNKGGIIDNPDQGTITDLNGKTLLSYDDVSGSYFDANGNAVDLVEFAKQNPDFAYLVASLYTTDSDGLNSGEELKGKLSSSKGRTQGSLAMLTAQDRQEGVNYLRENWENAKAILNSEEFGSDMKRIMGLDVEEADSNLYSKSALDIEKGIQEQKFNEKREEFRMKLLGSEEAARVAKYVDETISPLTVIPVAAGATAGTTTFRAAATAAAKDIILLGTGDAVAAALFESSGINVEEHPFVIAGVGIGVSSLISARNLAKLSKSVTATFEDKLDEATSLMDNQRIAAQIDVQPVSESSKFMNNGEWVDLDYGVQVRETNLGFEKRLKPHDESLKNSIVIDYFGRKSLVDQERALKTLADKGVQPDLVVQSFEDTGTLITKKVTTGAEADIPFIQMMTFEKRAAAALRQPITDMRPRNLGVYNGQVVTFDPVMGKEQRWLVYGAGATAVLMHSVAKYKDYMYEQSLMEAEITSQQSEEPANSP